MSLDIVTLKSRSGVNQGHWKWYHSVVPYTGYGFLLVFYSNFVPKTHHFWDIRLQKCRDRDLDNLVRSVKVIENVTIR